MEGGGGEALGIYWVRMGGGDRYTHTFDIDTRHLPAGGQFTHHRFTRDHTGSLGAVSIDGKPAAKAKGDP
jgi:hypothetical protein